MDSHTSTGRLFQRLGLQRLKADSPCVFNDILGTTRRPAAENLKDLQGTSKEHILEMRLLRGR